jgi:hypothetical protein
MTPFARRLCFALVVVLSTAVSGCAPDAQTPLMPEPAGPSLVTSEMNVLARYRTKPQITIAWAKKWIGPEGGRLDFLGFAIEVPAGAVDKVTMFSIRLPVDPNGSEHVVAEFGPHSKTFARPVAIELPYRNTSLDGATAPPTVVWWNDGWVDMGGALTRDGMRIRTLTDHFSTYGTTEARGGTFVTSGG